MEQELQKKLMLKEKIEEEIFNRKINIMLEKASNWILQNLCFMFPKKARKGIYTENELQDVDPEKFVYVDKEKSNKITKNFLKKLTHENNIVRGPLKQMEGTSLMLFPVDNNFRMVTYRII
jgi:hypothetical protein